MHLFESPIVISWLRNGGRVAKKCLTRFNPVFYVAMIKTSKAHFKSPHPSTVRNFKNGQFFLNVWVTENAYYAYISRTENLKS